MKKSLLLLPLVMLAACTNPDPNPIGGRPNDMIVPGEGNTPDYVPSDIPEFSYAIVQYDGQTADDQATYPANDIDLNPDLTTWTDNITVTYSGDKATVTGPGKATINGANVDISLPTDKLCRIVVTGSSSNGSLRISGDRKHLLQLENLTLTSTDRPAINDQVKKRVFVNLVGKTVVEDGATYAVTAEDRKGCFFAEDHVIIGGSGALQIKGNYRHGLATDGFLFVNSGATLVVTDAAKNAIHVKGSSSQNNAFRGIEVVGGYIYANTSAPAGKAMKCDGTVRIRGGELSLNCSGIAAWDNVDGSLSSAACIKSDKNVSISGADLTLTATGAGAKAINAATDIEISGGTLHIAMTGSQSSEQGDISTPKGLGCNGILRISGGGTYISATGAGARAIDADGGTDISGGVSYAFGRAWGLRTAAATAAVTAGVLLSGGEQNTQIEGCASYNYQNVTPDQETTIMNETEDAVLAAFRWPVAIPTANLLLHR